ncbi:MAG: 50S ribosomal protein L9 [Patescibacteria group bacterium]
MSRKVTVLLLEDIKELGKAGDIVTVSEGHARNFLFPEGTAALADENAQRQAERRRERAQAESNKVLAEAQVLAEKLEGTELTIKARRKEEDEGDEIFGSINARRVADELNQAAQIDVKPKDIRLPKAITRLGSQPVVVHLSPEVDITIQVTIIPDEEA